MENMNINFNFEQPNVGAGVRLLGKSALVFAIVLCFMFGLPFLFLCSFGEMTAGASRVPGLSAGIFFTLLGVGLLIWLIHILKKERITNSYIALTANKKIVKFTTLAEFRNVSVDIVIKELYSAIKKGYFSDAYMDLENQCILFPNRDLGGRETVSCSKCGANFTALTGYVATCPYCNETVNI